MHTYVFKHKLKAPNILDRKFINFLINVENIL